MTSNLALKLPPPASGLAELAAGLSWKPNEIIAMLWAYFDESGEHGPSCELTRLTIGGLIAPLTAWRAFELDWDAALMRHNRREFHRRDYGSDGIDEFIRIIARHVSLVVGFSAAAGGNTYEAYEKGLIDCLVKVASVSQTGKISLVLAKHSEFKPPDIRGYYNIVNWGSAQLGDLIFSDPKDRSPLQAADLIAHSLRSDPGTQRLREFGCHVYRWRDGKPV
jgi:hypothetical protein